MDGGKVLNWRCCGKCGKRAQGEQRCEEHGHYSSYHDCLHGRRLRWRQPSLQRSNKRSGVGRYKGRGDVEVWGRRKPADDLTPKSCTVKRRARLIGSEFGTAPGSGLLVFSGCVGDCSSGCSGGCRSVAARRCRSGPSSSRTCCVMALPPSAALQNRGLASAQALPALFPRGPFFFLTQGPQSF